MSDTIRRSLRTLNFVIAMAAIGMLGVAALMTLGSAPKPRLDLGLVVIVLSVAAVAVGTLFGFLFGLPRARVVDQVTASKPATASANSDRPPESHFLTNTNLIKVSDWVTTIVIGLGLVNLGKLIPAAKWMAARLRAPLGGFSFSSTVGLATLIAGLILGFLLGYLWTSIQVRRLFEELERAEGTLRMPNLVGKKLLEARNVLAADSLSATIMRGGTAVNGASTDESLQDVKVLSQSPSGGTKISLEEEVKLEIGP